MVPLKSFSGIYMVLNLLTGQYYVGSAITGNIYMRLMFFYIYKNEPNKHLFSCTGNKRVANAVKKYGLSEFAFLILEIVP